MRFVIMAQCCGDSVRVVCVNVDRDDFLMICADFFGYRLRTMPEYLETNIL